MNIIPVPEYKTRPSVELDETQVDALSRTSALTITRAREGASRWDVTANKWVGVVHGPDCEVRIEPKVPVARLLFLLGYVLDPSGWSNEPIEASKDEGLVPAVARAFVMHAERAVEQGVLQGYRSFDEALPTVIGRIRVGDQMGRRYGMVLPVEVTFDDFTADIIENQLLYTASTVLLRVSGVDPVTRRRLRHLTARLDGVTPLPLRPVPDLPEVTRINARYASATKLAVVILQGAAVEYSTGATPGLSFLFNMNKVFEDFVSVALGRALARVAGRTQRQYEAWLDDGAAVKILPDLVWLDHGRVRGVIDAKYKRIKADVSPNADIYQVHAYLTGLGLDRGWLVYAKGEADDATHTIVGAKTRITVTTLNLNVSPPALLDEIDGLAAKIAG